MLKRNCLTALLAILIPASVAWAEHPRIDEMAGIARLAHELENAAHHVHKAAERSAHHFTRRENDALRRLHVLDKKARHFHRQVERYRQDPYHTESDFRDLIRAFNRAHSALHRLHSFEHVRDDFRKVTYLVDDLDYYYGGRGGVGGRRGHGGHRDYDGYSGHNWRGGGGNHGSHGGGRHHSRRHH